MELKKKAPEDYKILFSAAKLAKDLNGFSATGDRETFEEIKKILDFEPGTKDGLLLKKNILDVFNFFTQPCSFIFKITPGLKASKLKP